MQKRGCSSCVVGNSARSGTNRSNCATPSASTLSAVVELEVAADFADVFAIKEGRPSVEGEHSTVVGDDSLLFSWRLGDVHRQAELTVEGAPVQISTHGFVWSVNIDRHDVCILQIDLTVALGNAWIEKRHHHPSLPNSLNRNDGWLSSVPKLRTADRKLSAAFDRAIEDIGALRLHDPTGRRRPVIAAGAPWYMTLFGRDALISAYMALPIDPTLAIGVLEALGEMQGREIDLVSEEEPGRIMHETRYLGIEAPTLTGGSTYYGSADATPLYVVLLGELSRWGLGEEALRKLLPHADRALAWMGEYGDRDGDGYIEYEKTSDRGLSNQGWKDSADGIRYHDGQVAEAPLALCEVQAYAYAAHLARADIARRLDQPEIATRHRLLAAQLKTRFNRDFWLDDLGLVCRGPRARQAPGRLADIEHRSLPVEWDRDRRARPVDRRTPDVAGDVERLGHQDPRRRRACVRPDELPLRHGVATRRSVVRRRLEAVWVRHRGADGCQGVACCVRGVEWPTARAVQRARQGRRRDADPIPDVVFAAGMGRGDAVPAAAHHAGNRARPRARFHGRADSRCDRGRPPAGRNPPGRPTLQRAPP